MPSRNKGRYYEAYPTSVSYKRYCNEIERQNLAVIIVEITEDEENYQSKVFSTLNKAKDYAAQWFDKTGCVSIIYPAFIDEPDWGTIELN